MPKSTKLDLQQQVGQLLIMGFDGLAMDNKLRITLSALHPGGVVLFLRNIESPKQTWDLLRECQATARYPMFLCVDVEGGNVDRLKDTIAPTPSAESVFATGNPRLFRMHGNILGLEVRALGFNTDFAPVLDLRLDASRSVLSSRTVSANPTPVVRYAQEFLRGLKAAKALGCGKHFPGLGEANLDTHKELPDIKKPWKKMWAEDLLPYRRLHRQLPSVMVAHACYPQVTKDKLPASLSRKWITDILRRKIGYRGLIISDDLEMGGVLAAGSIEDVAVETIRAGADIFLICHNQELVWRGYEAVLRAAEKDRKFAARVAQSAARILTFKRRTRELHHFAAEPKARIIATLRKIVSDYSRVIEEFRA
ncbi:MAG TPA: beta-N-acetylhexosaminidase [Candidatus Angelobacter sp.]